ncbi:MAG: glucose-1-phosphate cytidylyltransferase, partial [Negativicutes bacterium]|nr:glucose-1-phosphate cytidylyltransferase [Negativicutes bacterium]
SVLDLIEGDHTSWEYDLLPGLVTQKQLSVYRHRGFWQAMDTLRDRMMLEDLWARKKAPWKIW